MLLPAPGNVHENWLSGQSMHVLEFLLSSFMKTEKWARLSGRGGIIVVFMFKSQFRSLQVVNC